MTNRQLRKAARGILSGIGKIVRGLFRIVAMTIALRWWVVLVTAVVFGAAVYNLPRAAAIGILAALLALAYWFLGPYFRLAQAGLALEILRGAGATGNEPEEGPKMVRMDLWEEHQKREEAPSGAEKKSEE